MAEVFITGASMTLATRLFPAVARLICRISVVPATPGVDRSGWISLGNQIFIRYWRGDFRYGICSRAFSFKVRNENPNAVRLEVELTTLNDEGEQTKAAEFFTADAGAEGGDANWTIARDMVSFRIKSVEFTD
jgi:hypothetical protein